MASFWRDFLTRALAAIAVEVPRAAERLRAVLTVPIFLTVDGEPVVLRVAAGAVRVEAAVVPATLPRIETSSRALVELVDGRRSLYDSVRDEHVVLRGSVASLAVCHDVVTTLAQGLVRARSAPSLMSELRARARARVDATAERSGAPHARRSPLDDPSHSPLEGRARSTPGESHAPERP